METMFVYDFSEAMNTFMMPYKIVLAIIFGLILIAAIIKWAKETKLEHDCKLFCTNYLVFMKNRKSKKSES